MRKAGGIIATVAGSVGVIAAFITLFIGGVGGALEAEGANTVVGLGWGGVFFSFLVIGLGAATIVARGRTSAILLVIATIAGAILGGTFVAIFMALALIGGVMALLERRPRIEISS